MSPELLKLVVGAVVRYALTILGTLLVQHHVLTPDQASGVVASLTMNIVAIVVIAAPLVWSLVQKYQVHLERS